MTKRISRRTMLLGAGGAALAIPLLPSLLPRKSWAEAPTSHKRFVFVGAHYGRHIDSWYPEMPMAQVTEGVRHASLMDARNTEGHISKILSDEWDALRGKVSLLRGLDGMDVRGDAHGTAMALTGSGNIEGHVSFGYSLDVVLEESSVIYPEAPFVSALRTCPSGNRNPFSFSYSSATGTAQTLRPDYDPMETYLRLFHPDTLAKREARAAKQVPVLNRIIEDYQVFSIIFDNSLGFSRIIEDSL